jgi:hypothetical protein
VVQISEGSAKQEGPDKQEHLGARKARPLAPIPARSPHASPSLVDLSAHYNTALDDDVHDKPGNNLAAVPKGIVQLAGTPFDMRGLIQLAGCRSAEITHVLYPESICGIAVHARGRQVHFLQVAAWNTEEGTKIGEYRLHYADGRMAVAPILYQRNTVDWWVGPWNQPPTEAAVAWEGENPRSDPEIATIDFVSAVAESAPMLVAITVQ